MFVYTLNDYLRSTFGQKLYKISLDGGMTCPNRDGTLGYGGCIFCSAGGSGDFAQKQCDDIFTQIDLAAKRIQSKTSANKFIAYFQSYTNTYAPVEYLKKLFYGAVSHPQVEVLSIATRPDCLDDDVIELLRELNRIKPVWVELGLQTVNEDTARYIRRGYKLECYTNAIRRLKAAGIYVVTHVILYLPGETLEDMEKTVRYVGKVGSDGIKLALLHVLRFTDLEKDYNEGRVMLPTLEQYANTLSYLIECLPENVSVHRLTGDGPKSILIAPLWTGDKKTVLNTINRTFKQNDTTQARRWRQD